MILFVQYFKIRILQLCKVQPDLTSITITISYSNRYDNMKEISDKC